MQQPFCMEPEGRPQNESPLVVKSADYKGMKVLLDSGTKVVDLPVYLLGTFTKSGYAWYVKENSYGGYVYGIIDQNGKIIKEPFIQNIQSIGDYRAYEDFLNQGDTFIYKDKETDK